MKHFRIVIGLAALAMISTVDVFAIVSDGTRIGVPLDGGLLTILGAAGVAYYIARKKKAVK